MARWAVSGQNRLGYLVALSQELVKSESAVEVGSPDLEQANLLFMNSARLSPQREFSNLLHFKTRQTCGAYLLTAVAL